MSDMREMLVEQTGRLLSEACTEKVITVAEGGAWPAALWQVLEEAGLPLTLVGENAGGVGADLGDAAALMRLCGRHSVPAPIAETMIANWLWTRAGDEPLPGPASFGPQRGTLKLQASALTGTATGIAIANTPSDCILLVHKPAVSVLIRYRTSANAATYRNVGGELRTDLKFAGEAISAADVRPLPVGFDPADIRRLGALMRSAQMVGAMERALELAVEYVNGRVQFGRPLAKFQAIQHQLASAASQLAAAGASVDAATASQPGLPAFAFWTAVAKVRAGAAAGIVAATTHQVHGAIGFTKEYALHFATRRLWAWRDEFGTEAEWARELGAQATALGKDGLWARLTEAG